jgi:hypothetical protein
VKSSGTHTTKGTSVKGPKKNAVATPAMLRKPVGLDVRSEDERLVINLPRFDTPTRSRSGKSFLIATTGGVKRTSLVVDGSPVYVVASAFFYDNDGQAPAKFIPLFESEDEKEDEDKKETEEY